MNDENNPKQPKQPGFFWLFEWSENAEKFTDQQLATFTRAIVAAAKGESVEIPDDPLVELAFKYANQDRERMDYQRDRNSENGSKGGAPVGNKNASKQPKNNRKTTEKQPKTTENKPKDKDKDKDKDKVNDNITPLSGGIKTPAPVGMEFFGVMKNVMMYAAQHRNLVEQFGEDATATAIDELSCKLADGNFDSRNHYATLYYWLSYQRKNTIMATKPADREEEQRQVWSWLKEEERKEYLDTHDGLTPWQYEQQHGRS